ncbi:uncharacterized protein LOC105420923 isoform X1 [Amborella trichopoda]|uniref:uncharacterized protein LOC105420923 isoform X1 n=1 Tax=Amborella trichopoda TaxID=13333 RepID=UPI0005D36EC1|nr:uncharacterized protein LOC105420923 isoform X1 [Amborella trichopoda]|eukprot:XP_011624683.1 uncharacterized protein LOC105420923 isoform X1 [Amborella trichopoda]
MEEVPMQVGLNPSTATEIPASVVVDVESLAQPQSSGSPKMTIALSRKGSYRWDRRSVEEQEPDETTKKQTIKVASSQLEQMKQPLMPTTKALLPLTNPSPNLGDNDGRCRRFNRFTLHPRRILLIFATLSSMGTIILIYFTLAINRAGGA